MHYAERWLYLKVDSKFPLLVAAVAREGLGDEIHRLHGDRGGQVFCLRGPILPLQSLHHQTGSLKWGHTAHIHHHTNHHFKGRPTRAGKKQTQFRHRVLCASTLGPVGCKIHPKSHQDVRILQKVHQKYYLYIDSLFFISFIF